MSISAKSTVSFRYQPYRRPYDPRWRFITGFSSPKRILDLGCRSGKTASDFLKLYPGVELYGIDVAEEGPAFVRYTKANLNVDVLPYDDEFFDGVFMNHVLEHLTDPFHISREIRRVLRPSGAAYFEAPNWTSTILPSISTIRGQVIAPINFYDDPTHVRPWSKHAMYSYITQMCSFDVVAYGVRHNWSRLPANLLRFPYDLAFGDPNRSVRACIWDIAGWSVFGIGRKPSS